MDGGCGVGPIIPLRREFRFVEREAVHRHRSGVMRGLDGQYHRVVGGRDVVDSVFQRENRRPRTKVGGGRKRVARMYCAFRGRQSLDGCERFGGAFSGYKRRKLGIGHHNEDGGARDWMERELTRGGWCARCDDGDGILYHVGGDNGDDGAHDDSRMRLHRQRQRSDGRRDDECSRRVFPEFNDARKQQRLYYAYGREYTRILGAVGEYVAEYLYGPLGHPIIPGHTRNTDIQFRAEMERLVVGGEFWIDNQ